MANFIKKFIDWLRSLWSGLDKKTKQKVIFAFVNSLEEVVRRYFRNSNSQSGEAKNDQAK